MHQSVLLRCTVIFFAVLATLHMFLFNRLYGRIDVLGSKIIAAIKDSTPDQMTLPVTCPACPNRSTIKDSSPPLSLPFETSSLVQVTASQKLVEDAEKWRNLISMTSVVPQGVRKWFTYSETETKRLDTFIDDNPALIEYIRNNKIAPAPPANALTKLPAKDYSQKNQTAVLLEILQKKTNGFFVECGAFDGLTHSNTFYLERQLQWSGLMIEAGPINFKLALEKKRNVTLVPACLSLTTKPKMLNFPFVHYAGSRIDQNASPITVKVQCLPVYSILLAMNQTTVDLFSLDIEGHELDVLRTIPFNKVNIKVFLIEFAHIKEGKKGVDDFLQGKGYVAIVPRPEELQKEQWGEIDSVYVKKGSGYKETRD